MFWIGGLGSSEDIGGLAAAHEAKLGLHDADSNSGLNAATNSSAPKI